MLKSDCGPVVLNTGQNGLQGVSLDGSHRITFQQAEIIVQGIAVRAIAGLHLLVVRFFELFKSLLLRLVELQGGYDAAIKRPCPRGVWGATKKQEAQSAEVQQEQHNDCDDKQGFFFHLYQDLCDFEDF